MYTDWKVGDEIKICVAADIFCGATDFMYYVNDYDIEKADETCYIEYGTGSCYGASLNGLNVKVYSISNDGISAKHGICSSVPDTNKLRYLGSATTNSDGVCTIVTTVSEQDLDDFDDTPENLYALFICIDHEKVTSTTKFVEHILVSPAITPKCGDYTNQVACENGGCYWWTNNTCQSAPEGTTEYLDLYVRPFHWYAGKYQEALDKMITVVAELSGKLSNYFEPISGIEYTGIDILNDGKQEDIIIRMYFATEQETNLEGQLTLVAPIIIGGIALSLADIILIILLVVSIALIGIPSGSSSGDFEQSEQTEITKDLNTVVRWVAFKQVYDMTDEDAQGIVVCLNLAQDVTDVANCETQFGVELTKEGQMEIARLLSVNAEALLIYLEDSNNLDDDTRIILEEDLTVQNEQYDGLDDNSIAPEDAAKDSVQSSTNTTIHLEGKVKEQESEEECFIENPFNDECLITNEQTKWIKYGIIGVGAAYIIGTIRK